MAISDTSLKEEIIILYSASKNFRQVRETLSAKHENVVIPSLREIRRHVYYCRDKEKSQVRPQLTRKRKLTKTIMVFITCLLYKSSGYITARSIRHQIGKTFQLSFSLSYIAWIRKSLLGFNYRRARTRPKELTIEEKMKRVAFALNFANKDFKKVVFADECSVECLRLGLYHMRRPSKYPKTAFPKPRFVKTLHVWAGISWHGVTDIVIFTKNLTADGYKIIIEEYLRPFKDSFVSFNMQLVQDNDPKHSSKLCVAALRKNEIDWIKIPAYSPDINVIELVWAEMKRFIRKRYCESPRAMRKRIFYFFKHEFSLEKCRSYVSHIKSVLKKIIEMNGGWTNM